MMSQTLAIKCTERLGRLLRTGRKALILTTVIFCLAMPVWSQAQDATVRDRKLITRVEPQYPATLQRLYIGGVVRLEVVVAPNGSVEGATLMGGNPILGQAAIAAVKQWKYAAGGAKTTIMEKLEFDPHR
jgi:TonB family protein